MTQPPDGPYGYQYPPPSGYPAYRLPVEKPPDHMGWAIAALLLFWPLCIPAFINASRVDKAWYAGDRLGALRASESARTYGLVGVVTGVVLWLLAVLFFVAVLVIFARSGSSFSVPDSP